MIRLTYKEMIEKWFDRFGELPDEQIKQILFKMDGMTIEQIAEICRMAAIEASKENR